jgi:hypothetical protein
MSDINRLLKNAHLRRSHHPSSLQRAFKYASLLRISGALHLGIFDQPGENEFFNRLSKLGIQMNLRTSSLKAQHRGVNSFGIWILTFEILF